VGDPSSSALGWSFSYIHGCRRSAVRSGWLKPQRYATSRLWGEDPEHRSCDRRPSRTSVRQSRPRKALQMSRSHRLLPRPITAHRTGSPYDDRQVLVRSAPWREVDSTSSCWGCSHSGSPRSSGTRRERSAHCSSSRSSFRHFRHQSRTRSCPTSRLTSASPSCRPIAVR